jgi:hypothetical protein
MRRARANVNGGIEREREWRGAWRGRLRRARANGNGGIERKREWRGADAA